MISPKIKAYVGFAIKSGDVLKGLDNLKKRKVYLIIYSLELSNSAKEKCLNIANQLNAKIKALSEEDMFEIINNHDIKVIGITNKSLSEAIINNF